MRKFLGETENDDDESLCIDKLICYVVEKMIQSGACSVYFRLDEVGMFVDQAGYKFMLY